MAGWAPAWDKFWGSGISACAICDGASPIFKGKVLAVAGGGDTAAEEAAQGATGANRLVAGAWTLPATPLPGGRPVLLRG